MNKYTKCRNKLNQLKMEDNNEKRVTRARFRSWFTSKGTRNHDEFGEWSNYFSKEDEKCVNWDSLVYHWNEVNKEKKKVLSL